MSKRLLVLPDSNILFSASYHPGKPVSRLWDIPSVDILVCRYTLDEVSRHLGNAAQRARLWALVYRSHFVPDAESTLLPSGVSLAAKDTPVLLTAIDARADVLVTGDRRHFSHLFGTVVGGVHIESFETCSNRLVELSREQDRP